MNKIIATTLVLTTITLGLQTAFADTDKKAPPPSAAQQQAQIEQTWLGVSLNNVPEVLSRQLGDVIPGRQGVMVGSVSADSPAQKAGIQPFDIILNYGNQDIYSVEQLVSLVAADTAGKEVTMGVVRNGKKQDIRVTLGTHKLPTAQMDRSGFPMFGFNHQPNIPGFRMPGFRMPEFKMPALPDPSDKTHVMQQFESFQVKTLSDGRYHAEVEYQESGEERKKFVFEGKYDEVIEQIKNNKELPESKKNSLLNALKNNPNWIIPDDFMNFPSMPMMRSMPMFDPNFDNAPSWFRNGNRL